MRSPRKPRKATTAEKSKRAVQASDEPLQRNTESSTETDEPSTEKGSQKDTKTNRLSQSVLDERAAKAAIHWENRFKDLKAFKEKYGHCLVPKSFKENQSLAYWVQRNRRHYILYNNGEQSLLTADRISRLENIGFLFRAKGADVQSAIEKKNKREKGEHKWMLHFEEICKYKEVHGNCLVPKLYKPDRALASWVYNQRYQYKKKSEGKDVPLNDERIKKLDSIGFCWKAKSDGEWRESDRDRRRESSQDSWESKFERLVQFKEKHGHTLVPKQYKSDQSLSSWVFRQRRQYSFLMNGQSSSLSNDRLEKLKEIGFVFRVRPEKTDKGNEDEKKVDSTEPRPGHGDSVKEDASRVKTRRSTRISQSSTKNIPAPKPALAEKKASSSSSSSLIEKDKELNVNENVDVVADVETGPKNNGDDHKGSSPGKKNQNERTSETGPKVKKKMILSSESEPESSDDDSVSSSSSNGTNSEGSFDDNDNLHNSASVSSDQYEKSDDEIPLAVPPVVETPKKAQKNPEPDTNEVDNSHNETVSESKLNTDSQTAASPSNNEETSGKKQKNTKGKKRGNQHLSKTTLENESQRTTPVGKKAKC